MAEDERETRALQRRDGDGHVPSPLRDLALTDGAHLLPFLQFRNDHIQDLHDDACRDVRHDAHREDRERAESTAREQVQEAERALRTCRLAQLRDCCGIDTGHSNGGTESVHHDDRHGEENLLAKILHLEDVLHIREHWRLPLDRAATWMTAAEISGW